MRKAYVLLCAAALVMSTLVGCSETREDAPESDRSDAVSEAAAPRPVSDAAKARGLSVQREDEEPADGPAVALDGVAYDWRLIPDKGLVVTLEFGNENEVFERARAYVFLVAEYSARRSVNRGVFPLNVEFDGDRPVDYTAGTHILYRKDHTMKCFIPYTYREGYYDSLRVIVYSEEGDVLINRTYHLDVTGEPTGLVKTKPTLML